MSWSLESTYVFEAVNHLDSSINKKYKVIKRYIDIVENRSYFEIFYESNSPTILNHQSWIQSNYPAHSKGQSGDVIPVLINEYTSQSDNPFIASNVGNNGYNQVTRAFIYKLPDCGALVRVSTISDAYSAGGDPNQVTVQFGTFEILPKITN
jgi:hypothetical protein